MRGRTSKDRLPFGQATALRPPVREVIPSRWGTIDGEHAGAINCYSTDEFGYADLDEQLLELFTSVAEAALRGFLRYTCARDLARNLKAALDTRAVIDQAKGIIMAVRRIDADQAFAVLVRQSQKENIRLRDLAARFIAGLAGTAE
jgi:hypothetical protein